MQSFLTALIFAVVLPTVAAAHPGHGEIADGSSLAHYMTEPVHVVALFALVIGLLGGYALYARRRNVRSIRNR